MPSPPPSSHPTIPAAASGSGPPPHRYTAALANAIETACHSRWDRDEIHVVPNPGEPGFDPSRPKFYCLDMFPYPSGAGLHIGHPEGYTATDIICRYKRMNGFNVLHPMGWDAFGLPAEQYAIATGVHPAITTRTAIDNFRRQLKRFGFSYDWSRELGTIDDDYYKWTQWIFLRLFGSWFDSRPGIEKARPISDLIDAASKGEIATPAPWNDMDGDARARFLDSHRLAYRGEQTVNWCPKLGTTLANDEVIDGKSERGGFSVIRRPLRQWVFRITAYAERLLKGLAGLDWPHSTRAMQEEWVGRSEGAEMHFSLVGSDRVLKVFTTRPDTIFGATYMVVAPEHDLCAAVVRGDLECDAPTAHALADYVRRAASRGEVERQENKDKSGVFTGVFAINPATNQPIPVWTADYVLAGYGTGAVMAVPAHDERDFEFARAFHLPIRDVVYPRIVYAMHHFATNAYGAGEPATHWRDHLADFLGLVGGSAESGTAFALHLESALAGPSAGSDRASRETWLETIDTLAFQNFSDFRRRFESGTFHAGAGSAFSDPGIAVNSGSGELSLDGLPTARAKDAVIDWLQLTTRGGRRINYKLRDWVFSRQRYWGEPFPIVYDEGGRVYPVSEKSLPVKLPELADYTPAESDDPQPLLAKATGWMHTTAGEAGVDPALLPASTPVTRETNTMPGSAGSSWYAIRYCDPRNAARLVGREAEQYWMGPASGGTGVPPVLVSSHTPPVSPARPLGGVDLYLGGSEHAVGHLLYARFWQNVLYDLGEVSTPEPFRKLFHQGLITSFAYQRADKSIVAVDEVSEVSEGSYTETATGKPVTPIVTKMSKRYKNIVNPDDVIAEHGADTCRLYEMYMGPLEASKPWNPRDIAGCFRFLQRAWRLAIDESTGTPKLATSTEPALEKALHRLIAKVGGDIERMAFNTAIAAMIEFVNAATALDKGAGSLTTDQIDRFARVLAPFAPHIAEEIRTRIGNPGPIALSTWPVVDAALLTDSEVEIPVSVQGKVRTRITVPTGADAQAIEARALADPRVIEFLAGKPVKKIIVVPGKMVNIVV